MKLYNHFAAVGFSNTYLLAAEDEGDAVLIDPGVMDVQLLQLIEDHNYYIKDILITHSHTNHYAGIKTLRKIYDARLHAAVPELEGEACNVLENGRYRFSGLEIDVFSILGHSDDSLVYNAEGFFFTGDILSAGRTGTTPDEISREVLFLELEEKLFSRNEHGILLPGHGPPTTIRAERNLFRQYERALG
ncbi:MAG: MBL fold metallo-hydrolase [Spirochaetales bacterium]|nr:MBL fold metallo-hydrolase [Spirochaetales bacterium]